MNEGVDGHAVMTPMWRGVVIFRVVAMGAATVNLARLWDGYRHPGLATLVIALMAAWTLFSSIRFLRDGDARVAFADVVLVPAATLSTLVIDDPARLAAGGPVLTTVWSAGPVLSLAVATGWRGGLLASVVTVGVLAVVRRAADASFFYDAQLLIVVGLAVGLAADLMRAAARRLQEAVAAEAATAERERLARDIHDGVLQVLAFVRRRGDEATRHEPDGTAAELARLAGEQEVALRRLIASGPTAGGGGPATASTPPDGRDDGDAGVDLSAALVAVLPADTSMAAPAGPVTIGRTLAASLVAVVREAAANTAAHAGPGARLWVLVEDAGPEEGITVSVRDDGCGIPDGRLAAAAADGHLGVVSSMRARIAELGGTMTLTTAPGEGTEWEVHVPRSRDRGQSPRSRRSLWSLWSRDPGRSRGAG